MRYAKGEHQTADDVLTAILTGKISIQPHGMQRKESVSKIQNVQK